MPTSPTTPSPAVIQDWFKDSIKTLESLGGPSGNDPVRHAIYAATNCGGGEVGLYTLLGGVFRSKLEGLAQDLRLWINREVAPGFRPDFQVHPRNNWKKPLFLVQFKLAHWDGNSGEGPDSKQKSVSRDLWQLRDFAARNTSLFVCMVVFVRTTANPDEKAMLHSLEETLGVESKHLCELWNPEGVGHEDSLRVFVLDHETVMSWPPEHDLDPAPERGGE